MLKTLFYNYYVRNIRSFTRGDEFMKNKKQDEELLKMLNKKTRKIVIEVIKAYLQQHES